MDKYTLIALAAIAGTAIVGCDDKSTSNDTRTPGQKVQSAGEKTGDVAKDGIDSAARGLGTVVDKTRDAARTAADKTSAATENARERVKTSTPPTTQPVVEPSPTR